MKLRVSVMLFASVVFLEGCCFFIEPPPPPPPNDAKVVVKSSNTVGIEDVSVQQEGKLLVIEGTLHPGSFVQKKAGHVDLRIVDADGQVLRELKVDPDEAVFRKESGKVSPFSVSVDLTVSPDTEVHLCPHAGPADNCTR